jgi:magnesium transporter
MAQEQDPRPGSEQAPNDPPAAPRDHEEAVEELSEAVAHQGPEEAAELLATQPADTIVDVLQQVNPATAQDVLFSLPEEQQKEVLAAAPPESSRQWALNQTFPEESVGRLMDPPVAVFVEGTTVGEAIEELRDLVKGTFITYAWVVDHDGVLVGVVAMRELLFTDRAVPLDRVMVPKPFALRPEMAVKDAMKLVLNRHYPVYPVSDANGRMIGLVRGHVMFEEQAIELSAQPGSMVGVEKEERLSTPWTRSLASRHPWLQLNLLTAFVAAAVVGFFQETIDRLVVLAVFLPVLAGQSGNTGCQALAVALRGLTLGELKPGRERALVLKEGLLGLLNGSLVGISAAIGMYVVARMQDNQTPGMLAFVVFLAMIGSCVVSGLSGALIPLTLKKLGFDPATASSIFLTTATDVASMGLFLSLATLLVR